MNNYLVSKEKKDITDIDRENFENIKKELDENCLKDSLSSFISVDETSRNILFEENITESFKLCVFGLMYYEVEKSYYYAAQHGLLNEKGKIKEDLLFKDIKKILGFFDESLNSKFRNQYNQEIKRCSLNFPTFENNFNELRFTSNFYIDHIKNDISNIYLGYKFSNKEKIAPTTIEFWKNDNKKSYIKSKERADVLKKELKKYTLSWDDRESVIEPLKIILFNDPTNVESENSGYDEITFLINKFQNCENKNKITTTMKIKFPKFDPDTRYNFVPVFCNETLNKKNKQNYNFIQENDCQILRENRLFLKKEETTGKFTFDAYTDKNFHKNTQELLFHIFVLNWKFTMKDTMEQIEFCGLEKNCDSVLDLKLNIFFLICYQKERLIKKNEDENIITQEENENFFKEKHFILTLNEKANEDCSHGYFKSRRQLLNETAMMDIKLRKMDKRIEELEEKNRIMKVSNTLGTRYSGDHGTSSKTKPNYTLIAAQVISIIGMLVVVISFTVTGLIIIFLGITIYLILKFFVVKDQSLEDKILAHQFKNIKIIEEHYFHTINFFEELENFANLSVNFSNEKNEIDKKIIKVINPLIKNNKFKSFYTDYIDMKKIKAEQRLFHVIYSKQKESRSNYLKKLFFKNSQKNNLLKIQKEIDLLLI